MSRILRVERGRTRAAEHLGAYRALEAAVAAGLSRYGDVYRELGVHIRCLRAPSLSCLRSDREEAFGGEPIR